MLDFVRQLLGLDAGDPQVHERFEPRLLAAAALMVEAARLDGTLAAVERERIGSLLRDRLGLDPELAQRLLAAGERASAESVDWQGFTHEVKEGFDHPGRVGLVEMLWEVAYADGHVHPYEASLIRRVTGLLYLADGESGAARRRVAERLGLPVT